MCFFLCFSLPIHVAFGWNKKIKKYTKIDNHRIKAVDGCVSYPCMLQTQVRGFCIFSYGWVACKTGERGTFSFPIDWKSKPIGCNVSSCSYSLTTREQPYTFANASIFEQLWALPWEGCDKTRKSPQRLSDAVSWQPRANTFAVELTERGLWAERGVARTEQCTPKSKALSDNIGSAEALPILCVRSAQWERERESETEVTSR